MKLSRGQKTGDGKPSLHDRDMELVALPNLVFSLTVHLGAPRTVPGKGPLHPGRRHRQNAGHSRHLGRRNRFSSLRSSPLPFDLHRHGLPGIAGLFPGGDGRGVKGGMGNPGIFHKTIDQGGMGPLGDLGPGQNPENPGKGRLVRQGPSAPESQNPAKRRIGLQTFDQRSGRGEVQDRFGHKGPGDRPPVVRRTSCPPPALSDLILDPDNLENRHDLSVLFRQRTQAILDPGKQGSLNASPDWGKFPRTSWG